MAKSATLEIHQINVGQGDCTLVLARDLKELKKVVATKDIGRADGDSIDHLPYCIAEGLPLAGTVQGALLIDAGNDGYGPDVREYLEKHGAIDPAKLWQPRLWLLATHYHDDHQDGLRSVMRNALDANALKIARAANAANERNNIDARVDTTEEKYRPGRFYHMAPDRARDRSIGMFTAILAELKNQAPAMTDTSDPEKTKVMEIPRGGGKPGERVEIVLGTGSNGFPIKVVVLAADQAYFPDTGWLQIDIPNKNPAKKARPLSENDRSVVLMVEYGSFRHFLAGDIGGSTCAIEADVEGALAPALPGMLPARTAVNGPKIAAPAHCCSTKLSHHGSRYSNTASIFASLTPRIAMVSSGFRQYFHGHPTADVVTRMATTSNWGSDTAQIPSTVTNIYATEIASMGKGKPFDPDPNELVSIVGDTVLRPVDESLTALNAQDRTGVAELEIQVYGSGEQSWVDPGNAKYALRATATGTSVWPYPIGPFTISCTGH